MFISGWMDKYVVYPYGAVLLGNKMGMNIDTSNNIDQSQNYAKWDNPGPKEYHILCDFMYTKFWKITN